MGIISIIKLMALWDNGEIQYEIDMNIRIGMYRKIATANSDT